MKSKFNAVIKVKKQQFDKAQTDLNAALQRQKENERLLGLAQEELLNLGSLKGQISSEELRANVFMEGVAREALARAKEKVELSHKEVNHYQFLYKKAHLDYEKIKYLQSEELKAMQKAMQKAEEKFLDELAISRFLKKDKDE
ncbi:flagellar FliJ family protein [Campylobacter upsaliensis]|uniref:flagellar export protein FliJ n=1 Tax=Campylobacter TaxID=194 RepID=UPI001B0ADFD3|nr:flagellar export protein FliJ [Campylobacter upsaliensis]MDL0102141.1 flagellar export protein FliJ [Campylobacter felis]EHG9255971.1 FliJ family protein [Campylobacter upsaliensis]EKM1540609.1 flagellar FliJ family protein [Campylobacter upsaliensis]HEF3536758.1 flagellar FliJ family protein [Campylobacter upsaliensis]HEF3559156.1 flagellar FliJ family protein [Campylobacter upsaliensis]